MLKHIKALPNLIHVELPKVSGGKPTHHSFTARQSLPNDSDGWSSVKTKCSCYLWDLTMFQCNITFAEVFISSLPMKTETVSKRTLHIDTRNFESPAQVIPSRPKSSQVVPCHPKSSQVIPSHPMSFQIHHPCPKGSPPLGSRPLNDMSNAVPGSPTSAARKRPMIHQAWNPKLRGVSTMRACMQNNTGEKSKRTSVRWRARVTATKQDRTTKTKELAATQLCADLAARLWMSLLRRESSANERRKIESRTKLHSADTRFQSYTDLRNYSGNYSTIPSVQDSWKRSNPSTVCGLPNFSRLHFGKNLQKSGEVQRVLAAAWGV